MHDTEEILVAFTFKNGDGAAITVDPSILLYEVFLNSGAQPKQVTVGTGAVFDLFSATAAELAAAFPTSTPPNGVWLCGKGSTSPTGAFIVRATASPPTLPAVTGTSPVISVIRDPVIPVTVVPAALGSPRARTH